MLLATRSRRINLSISVSRGRDANIESALSEFSSRSFHASERSRYVHEADG